MQRPSLSQTVSSRNSMYSNESEGEACIQRSIHYSKSIIENSSCLRCYVLTTAYEVTNWLVNQSWASLVVEEDEKEEEWGG